MRWCLASQRSGSGRAAVRLHYAASTQRTGAV